MVDLLSTIPHSPPSTPGPYRVGDYLALPDEPRCELVYGRLYMAPAPSVRHQIVVAALFRALDEHAAGSGGVVLFAPVDVVLTEHSVVQPDVVYLAPERRHLLGDRIEGAPDLVVEVLSPGIGHRDRGAKLQVYAESGVREYWIVDPEARTFEFLVRSGRRFFVALAEDEVYASTVVPDLRIDVARFWTDLPSLAV